MAKARKEVVLAKDKVVEARYRAIAAKDAARATEDVAATIANDAQDIGLQVGFKVLCQALLQIALNFNIDALDMLVIMKMVDVVVLEAEAKHEVG